MPDTKSTWRDSLLKVFRAKDDAEKEAVLAEIEAAKPDDDVDGGGKSEGDGAVHHHVEIHMPGSGESKPKDAEPGVREGDESAKDQGMTKDEMEAAIATAVAEKVGSAVEAATAPLKETIENLQTAIEDMSDPDDMGMQDAIARADILAPGIQLPARDAKPGSQAHRDAVGGFQRAALKQALTTDAGRAAVTSVLGHAQPARIASMPANEVAIAFRAASQLMVDHNAAATVTTLQSATAGYVRDEKGAAIRPMTPADLQATADRFYGRGPKS